MADPYLFSQWPINDDNDDDNDNDDDDDDDDEIWVRVIEGNWKLHHSIDTALHCTKVSLWFVYISCGCSFSETIAIC